MDSRPRYIPYIPLPAVHPGSEDAAARPALLRVERDGARWSIGTAADVTWITTGTTAGLTITSAIPPVFEAYATLVLPDRRDKHRRQDRVLLSVLRDHTSDQPWWLGYLDTGADDVVFPDAARTTLYSGWSYVLVNAGPEQAATWRERSTGSFFTGVLPNLMFPADHSWLVSTLWDDDWTCVGGPAALINDLRGHPTLRSSVRQVDLGKSAAPPGHRAS